MSFGRIIWIVLDSVGIGDMPDAADYEKDLELFRTALEHVKAAGGR